jgi:exodeoxyribonuclease V beta subunit
LRLLYVALTRAKHFLWLGVAAVAAGRKGENRLHESALGYLLTGGEPVPADRHARALGAPARRPRRDRTAHAGGARGLHPPGARDVRPELVEAAAFNAGRSSATGR